eukprot:9481232-Pyramimonas_sp.AAC.1
MLTVQEPPLCSNAGLTAIKPTVVLGKPKLPGIQHSSASGSGASPFEKAPLGTLQPLGQSQPLSSIPPTNPTTWEASTPPSAPLSAAAAPEKTKPPPPPPEEE